MESLSTLLSRFPKSMPHWGRDRWALAALLLLAWALRLPPILDNRFHPDEALYGYWGLLIGQGQDPWLVTVPVYKPPLLPYLVAGAQALFGNSEFTVRLPGLAAGLLIVPLVAALAYSLYRDRWIAAAAAVGVALSPFAILLSATAFTDPPMVALGLAACIAAARGRPGWAGTLAGLAFATKQTGLLWMPLVALIQISNLSRSKVAPRGSPNPRFWPGWFGCAHHRSGDPGRAKLDLVRLVVRFSLIVGLVFAWDAVRVTRGAESFWRIGVTGYGGLRLTWPQELWPRLRGWIGLMHYFFVSPVVNGALLVGLPALVWNTLGRRHRTRESFADLLLISFSLIYLLLHWLWAFPVWDRYLLPLVPILAILFSRIVKSVTLWLQSAIRNGFDTPTATQPKPQSATLRLRSGQVHNPQSMPHLLRGPAHGCSPLSTACRLSCGGTRRRRGATCS